MKLKGTDFQIKVWKYLLKIPKGKVKTYKEVAVAIKTAKKRGYNALELLFDGRFSIILNLWLLFLLTRGSVVP